MESDILIILALPKEDLEELLKTKMDLPALPQSWFQSFEAELSPAGFAENNELAENIELLQISSAENSIATPFRQVERHRQMLSSSPVLSSRVAEDAVDPVQPALHTDDRQIYHAIIEEFGRHRVPGPWHQSSILQPSHRLTD